MENAKEVKRLQDMTVKERIASSDAVAVPELLRKRKKKSVCKVEEKE